MSPQPLVQNAEDGETQKNSYQFLGEGYWINIGNVVALLINILFNALSGAGVLGPDNVVLSAKYQLITTPSGAAFSIWGIIFAGESIFALAQLFPPLRYSKVVFRIAPWWWAACLFQSVWTVAFAQEAMVFSLVCMLGILFSLAGLVLFADLMEVTTLEYWVLRMSFSVHLGWILAASTLNVGTVAVAAGAQVDGQLTTAIVSLAVILAVASIMALGIPKADAVVPLVAAWASFFIYQELGNPVNLNDKTREFYVEWNPAVISAVRNAVQILAILSLLLAGVGATRRFFSFRAASQPPQQDAKASPKEALPAAQSMESVELGA